MDITQILLTVAALIGILVIAVLAIVPPLLEAEAHGELPAHRAARPRPAHPRPARRRPAPARPAQVLRTHRGHPVQPGFSRP